MLNGKFQVMRFVNYLGQSCLSCPKLCPFGLLIALSVIGCRPSYFQKNEPFALQSGDLLFQDVDCGPLCDAIEKVTTGYRGAAFSHIGIAAEDANGNFQAIEALSGGVTATPLQTFLDRSLDSQCRPKIVVGRLKPPFRHLIPLAVREALALKDKPYDKLFAVDNDSYYCSELIYEIFLRANGNKPLFTLQPMTFNDPDTGLTLLTWQDYFSKLGVPVPQGRPGINPGAISRSPVLNIVYSYGIPDGWKKKYPD